ncbi:hypothetical protein ACW0TR_02065, partial [Fusobacterium polymorphum]
EMVRRISEEITRYLLELGSRGRLVNMQVSELIWDLDEEDAIVVGGRIVDDVLAKYVIGMDDESLVTFLHMMRKLYGGMKMLTSLGMPMMVI